MSKFTTLEQLKLAQQRVKTEVGKVETRVQALEDVGAQANVLEGVKVNGTALSIANKLVDILIATGSTNGTIKVNNVDVAVKGLAALAYKAEVGMDDLATALKAVINAKAEADDLDAVEAQIETLIGSVTGDDAKSIRAISAEEVAKVVASAPEDFDTLKEIADWIENDTTGAAKMANDIQALQGKVVLGTYNDGGVQKEYATVKAYVEAVVAGIGIEGYYTKDEIDEKFTDYYDIATMDEALGDKADKVSGAVSGNFAGLDANGNLTDSGKKAADFVAAESGKRLMTNTEGTKLAGIAEGATKVEASTNDGKIKVNGSEITVVPVATDAEVLAMLNEVWGNDVDMDD